MSVLWLPGHVPVIKKLDPQEFIKRLEKIKPIYTIPNEDGDHLPWYMMSIDPFNQAFTWDPKPRKQLTSWKEVARIETYHTCGYISLFKPTIEEVLNQIPDHLVDEIDGFETLKGDTVACFQQGDGHRTITILYKDLSEK